MNSIIFSVKTNLEWLSCRLTNPKLIETLIICNIFVGDLSNIPTSQLRGREARVTSTTHNIHVAQFVNKLIIYPVSSRIRSVPPSRITSNRQSYILIHVGYRRPVTMLPQFH